MANQTDQRAKTVHGGNPQSLVDQIVRNRIYSNLYWKEKLAGINAEDLVDRGIDDLKYIGGTYGGNRKPTKFMCLLLKMLQIQPDLKIIFAFIENQNYKYIRALGMMYLRLVGTPEEIYRTLEPLLAVPKRLIERDHAGSFIYTHIDELADKLLRADILYDVNLPRLIKRDVLEDEGRLQPKVSVLEEALQGLSDQENLEMSGEEDREKSKSTGQVDQMKINRKKRDRSNSASNSANSSEQKKKDKKKHKRSRSREKKRKGSSESHISGDEEERKQKKKEKKKLRKLLKKAKKERREKELQEQVELKKKETADSWAKIRQEQLQNAGTIEE